MSGNLRSPLAACRDGPHDDGPRLALADWRWDEVQNTSQDCRALARHLTDLYRELFWPRGRPAPEG